EQRTLVELGEAVRSRKVSPVELTRVCLERIEQCNPSLNAFITVMAESALGQARTAEKEILAGNWRGPLHGIPIGLKDLIDTAGVPTTAGSELYKHRIPIQRAAVVLSAGRGRGGAPRQAEPARVRLRRQFDDQRLWRG